MKLQSTVLTSIQRSLLLAACLLCSTVVLAQAWTLNVLDGHSSDTLKRIFATRQEALREANNLYVRTLDDGFLLAEADTVVTDSTIICTLKRNEEFVIRDVHFFHQGTWSVQTRVKKALSGKGLGGVFSRALVEFENEGYPFVSLYLDSLREMPARRKNQTHADVFVTLKEGPLIVNDSLYVRSSQPLPFTYLSNYIDFRNGRLYSEQRIRQTERRLREIAFLQIKRSPEVRFEQGKADLFLFIERKKANYFNGVAGIRPDERTGKTNITGDAEVRLINPFNRGEELGLVWRKLQPLTQDLTVKAMVPYLFKSPLAIDGRLQIYKRDTSFTSVKILAGAGVLLPRNQRVRVFVERNRSDVLTNFYTAGGLANAQHTLYGLSAQLESLDYRWNPRKGFSLLLEGATGFRETSQVLSESALSVRRPLTRAEVQAEYFIPVFTRQTILIGMKGAMIASDSLYDNEVFRIGGLRTIRGINEESIFATAWSLVTLEYRWLLEENSAVFVFLDQAWYEYKSIQGYLRDVPISVGAGVNFETKAGIFTFNYALGKQFENPVLIRNGKISFGFRSLF